MKKIYEKPQFSMVELRTEERLADCTWYWIANQPDPKTCTSNRYAEANCFFVTSHVGKS